MYDPKEKRKKNNKKTHQYWQNSFRYITNHNFVLTTVWDI